MLTLGGNGAKFESLQINDLSFVFKFHKLWKVNALINYKTHDKMSRERS